jgi:hypothetical protein
MNIFMFSAYAKQWSALVGLDQPSLHISQPVPLIY